METTIRFWGVRGSIASPGAHTVRTGGNTSCVEVQCGETTLVLDAGTGMRALGERMLAEGRREATILLSHLHWDHIQGLPFFLPAWLGGHRLTFAGMPGLRGALDAQMQPPCFPVRLSDMSAELHFRELGSELSVGDVRVRAAKLNHPGGVLGYRIEHAGTSVVYATDTEHYSCPDPHLVALAKDADVLIYDAMYTEDEYAGRVGPSKVGWGHSTWEAGVAVADAANVGRLVLFHHDPVRDDAAVDALERAAALRRPGTVAAREGDALVLRPDQGSRGHGSDSARGGERRAA
ncbi:MAG: MBL fold metallo-hydrolase [Sandaracinaceae bacterium]|mgnify:CR=1 FL=1|nr:MAG: MBL fold metallo-hydrolase [Sandaracinaceae bacterium]HBQ14387.1 MBL fold metallo-hydrolase [Myxococcales bacterium]